MFENSDLVIFFDNNKTLLKDLVYINCKILAVLAVRKLGETFNVGDLIWLVFIEYRMIEKLIEKRFSVFE